jgi:hypothetical protein
MVNVPSCAPSLLILVVGVCPCVDESLCLDVSQSVSKCLKLSQCVSKFLKVSQCFSSCFKGYLILSQCVSMCLKVSQVEVH